ncbi:MAG: hypothetical protein Q8Q23_00465 [bacterium]|nr:hypothetical protein [bacterium]
MGKNEGAHHIKKLRVQVSKKLSMAETDSIVSGLLRKYVVCGLAYFADSNEYEVWREVLADDEPRKKNQREGMTPHGVIEIDADIAERRFVVVWGNDQVLYVDKKSAYAIQNGLR